MKTIQMGRRLRACTAALGALVVATTAAAVGFETPPTLSTAEFAPRGVALRGEHYTVDPYVRTDGLLATYTIRSDFGEVEARGPGMLRMRVAEIEALTRLKEMEKSDVFVNGLKGSATAIGQGVVNVVTNPVETVKGIPAGVGRFLERTARQARTGIQKLGDARQGGEPGASREAEEGRALPGATPADPRGAPEQNVAVATGVAAGRAARDFLGYDEKRRELARELRVDPYTTNPLLAKELDDVAWAAFAGGLGVRLLASQVPGAQVVTTTSMVSDWVYDRPPGDLKVWIDKTLVAMGVDAATVDLFLRTQPFSLTLQSALVLALEKMAGVEGRPEVIETAVTAENADQARFLAAGLTMLANEHARDPLAAIIDGRPVGMTRAGRAVATMPLDYVCWTAQVAAFCERDDLRPHRPRLVLAGRLSERARAEVRARGWQVLENAPIVDLPRR